MGDDAANPCDRLLPLMLYVSHLYSKNIIYTPIIFTVKLFTREYWEILSKPQINLPLLTDVQEHEQRLQNE